MLLERLRMTYNRVDVKIERLASKVELKLKEDNNDKIVVEPTGAVPLLLKIGRLT